MRKTRRSEGEKRHLMDLANRMERYYANQNSYTAVAATPP